MNIFYLDKDPYICAKMHCDKHVVKMILETAQLLSTAHNELDGTPHIECYKSTHKNHPSAVWVRENAQQYLWAHALLTELCAEYTRRYGKIHKTERVGIVENLETLPVNILYDNFREPPQCMPDQYKQGSAIGAYRAYYIGDKAYMARWLYSDVPGWFSDILCNSNERINT